MAGENIGCGGGMCIDWGDAFTGEEWQNPGVGGTTGGGLMDAKKLKEQQEAQAKAAAEAKAKAAAEAKARLPENAKDANPFGAAVPQGRDLLSPGVYESAFAAYGGGFFDEGEAKGFWDENADAYGRPGASERVGGAVADDLYRGSQGDSYGQDYVQGLLGSNKSKDPGMIDAAWKNMQGVSANMDPYYDLAFEDSSRQINRASASRGRFNSTESMRNISDASARLNAQQAKDEASYKLDRARAMGELAVGGTAGKADWMTSMGNLAFNAADEQREYGEAAATAANMAQTSELNRLQQALNGALGIDAAEVNSLSAGMSAAEGAQGARFDRLSYEQEQLMKIADRILGYYGGVNTEDQNKGEAGISTGLAAAEEKRRLEEEEANRRRQEMADAQATLVEMYGGGAGGTSAGGAGGGGAKP